MKKLYFAVLMLAISTLLMGQTRKYHIGLVDSGTTTADSVHVPDGYWLSQINFPTLATGTDSYTVELGSFLEGSLTWKEFWYNGSQFSVAIKSGGECIEGKVPSSNWANEWLRLVFDTEQDSTVSIEYTFEEKK